MKEDKDLPSAGGSNEKICRNCAWWLGEYTALSDGGVCFVPGDSMPDKCATSSCEQWKANEVAQEEL